jgi:hypothetical protein
MALENGPQDITHETAPTKTASGDTAMEDYPRFIQIASIGRWLLALDETGTVWRNELLMNSPWQRVTSRRDFSCVFGEFDPNG